MVLRSSRDDLACEVYTYSACFDPLSAESRHIPVLRLSCVRTLGTTVVSNRPKRAQRTRTKYCKVLRHVDLDQSPEGSSLAAFYDYVNGIRFSVLGVALARVTSRFSCCTKMWNPSGSERVHVDELDARMGAAH